MGGLKKWGGDRRSRAGRLGLADLPTFPKTANVLTATSTDVNGGRKVHRGVAAAGFPCAGRQPAPTWAGPSPLQTRKTHRLTTCATEGALSPLRAGKTHRLKTCATGGCEGLPVSREPGSAASEATMAKRSRRAESAGQDARSERPATGLGQPRAAAMDRHRLKTCATGGAPSPLQTRKTHRLTTCATGRPRRAAGGLLT